MDDVAYIMQGQNVILVLCEETHTISPSHPNYTRIVDLLKEACLDDCVDDLYDLVDVPATINRYGAGKVQVVNDTVTYQGRVLHNALTRRMLQMMSEGFNIDPLIAFLENLMENPSQRAVEELYMFLEKNDLPITSDGHFLAYKNVRENYTDIHSGKFDNSIGSICEMPRNAVNDNRDVTCSTGLHFCALGYLSSFSGQHTMILKINPRDVVSIPSDYNDMKGRCCRYEVVGEHNSADRYNTEAFDRAVDDRWAPNPPRAVVSYDLETGEIIGEYDNLGVASRSFDIPESYINRVLKGQRKSTGGVGWAWKDEYDEPLGESYEDEYYDRWSF